MKRQKNRTPAACSCTRRSFLRGGGLALAGFGVSSLFPEAFMRHALAMPGGSDARLLFIFLRGGNDGLNAVIPHGDPDYNVTNRGALHIPASSAIDLNGFASLHPGLGDVMDVFNAGDLAVLHRIGFPDNSRSHFDDQRVWENGDPAQPGLFSGWLARYIVDNALSMGADLPALSVQALTPILLRGQEKYVNIANPPGFDVLPFLGEPLRSKFTTPWPVQVANLQGPDPYGPILSQTGVKLYDILAKYDAWDQANWDPKDPANPTWSLFPVSAATNPPDAGGPGGLKFSSQAYPFFNALKVLALSMLESDPLSNSNGTRVAGTELNGWDLHSAQGAVGGRHHELLSWVAYGLRSLHIVLSGAAVNEPRGYPSIWDKTIICTLSEFGRTTITNGSDGTDHAAASCMFVQGGQVNGGVYNCDPATWPAGVMFGVNNRYLLQRTDFRAVFWEILRDHMGSAPTGLEVIFPGYTSLGLGAQELGLIASS